VGKSASEAGVIEAVSAENVVRRKGKEDGVFVVLTGSSLAVAANICPGVRVDVTEARGADTHDVAVLGVELGNRGARAAAKPVESVWYWGCSPQLGSGVVSKRVEVKIVVDANSKRESNLFLS
jgi:hypothetical protein